MKPIDEYLNLVKPVPPVSTVEEETRLTNAAKSLEELALFPNPGSFFFWAGVVKPKKDDDEAVQQVVQ